MNRALPALLLRRLRAWHRRRRVTAPGGPVTRTRLPGRPTDTGASAPAAVEGDELRARALMRALIDEGHHREEAGR
ncbi:MULTISPECIES: hypothetical protein [Streptomyces]|uniref:hypothetical protein n=1 Tax=Streptomyces TaxID=1883 RepID=UPI00118147D8|nr:hypothetical protein [Streptomyces kasugaensis]